MLWSIFMVCYNQFSWSVICYNQYSWSATISFHGLLYVIINLHGLLKSIFMVCYNQSSYSPKFCYLSSRNPKITAMLSSWHGFRCPLVSVVSAGRGLPVDLIICRRNLLLLSVTANSSLHVSRYLSRFSSSIFSWFPKQYRSECYSSVFQSVTHPVPWSVRLPVPRDPFCLGCLDLLSAQ